MKNRLEHFIEKYNKFVYPNIWWVYFSLFICIALWVVVFYFHIYTWWFKGPLLVFTIYSGLITSYSIPQIVSEIVTLLNQNKYFIMFMNDLHLRMFVTLYMNLTINFCFAALNIINGVRFDSNWQMAIGLYYIVLAMMRFYLLSYLNRYETQKGMKPGEIELNEFKKYRMTGWFLIIILIPLIWILSQMIEENQSYNYPGSMIYIMIAFNIYVWGSTIFSQMMYGKVDNLILTSTRAIAFACALVSTLALLTSVLGRSGYSHPLWTNQALIALLGTAECFIIFFIGIRMINRAQAIISMNSIPRKFREKVSLKEKRQERRDVYARQKAAYESHMAQHWINQKGEIKTELRVYNGSRISKTSSDSEDEASAQKAQEPVLDQLTN